MTNLNESTVMEIQPKLKIVPKPNPLDDPIAKLLIDRANRLIGPEHREQRMFVQFDAWTDPTMLVWLQSYGKRLPANAKKLFETPRPEIDLKFLICGFPLLEKVPLDRAIRRAAGEVYGVPVRVSDAMARRLEAKNTTVREVICRIAEYMHAIFSLHFHQDGRKTPSPDLQETFARFAAGRLRIVDDVSQQELNAEPDSALFFVFAEFCIQAAFYRAHPGRKWWLALAGLFASLQEVFCLRYHRNGAQRQCAEYGDTWFDPRRPIRDDLLLDHAASVQSRDNNLEKLAERVTWNAFWNFFDDVL